ncbi:MAG TPA: hypothetical protein VEF05_03150 [Terriglobales bacterium]|nr:hypothetical protein [Terriglobales bacterium]
MQSLLHFFPIWSRFASKTRLIENNGRPPGPTALPAWRTLYVAALFETDEKRMVQRIAEAKSALVARARELFLTSEDHLQEESAIDEAFQALHALEQCSVHLCAHPDDFRCPIGPDH